MFINSIGTLVYTLIYGKKISEDQYGNFFYVSKKNNDKRWVLYKKVVDPTLIPTEWQLWLTNTRKPIPKKSIENKFFWQKERRTNKTGTNKAYHPKKNEQNKKEKNILWKP